MTTDRPQLRVLFFDVFGTCVIQEKSVADEFSKAAKEALESNTSISEDVRTKTKEISHEQWIEFGRQWNTHTDKYTHAGIAERDTVDWKAVDQYRIASLFTLLADRGLVILDENSSDSAPHAKEGSLWDDSQLQHLGRIWHRLTPWPDTCRGLELLNKKFTTVTLSNTYNELIKSLVAHSNIPFQETFSSDLFGSYKPNSKVYLGAAEKMGVKPEECGLVAAHLGDLRGAKACGFYAISVERPFEEKAPALRKENIPDMIVGEDEGGFVTLAKRLGIEVD